MILSAQLRDSSEKLTALRTNGFIPAVVYGTKQENTLISVPHAEFLRVFKTAGENTVITLQLPKGTIQVLVHEVQLNAVNHVALHIDFLAIDAKTAVSVGVPIEFVGESPAVKAGAGLLNTLIDELEIEVLPNDIPAKFVVDISVLQNLHDSIRVKDIVLPKSAQATVDEDTVIAVISEPRKEDDDSLTNEIDLDSIEVEKKGKKEETE